MNKQISRFGLGLIVLSLTVVSSAQIVDQEPQLKSLPKLETRPANERHLFGAKITVNVSVDSKGKVTAVNSVDGPGWICPGVVTPEVTALRSAAEEVAKKAEFEPAKFEGREVDGKTFVEIDFPVSSASTRLSDAKPVADNKTNNPKPSRGNVRPVVSIGMAHTPAKPLPKPMYPSTARAVGATGVVRVKVLLAEDGSVLSAEPIYGHPLLRPSARTAACGASFVPTYLSGKPVYLTGIIAYNFVP